VNLDVEQPGSGFNARPEENGGDVRPPDQVVDRAAAFAAVTPAIPRKFVYWVLVGAAVLGLGGLAAEHLFSSAGLNPQATTSHAATTTTGATIQTPLPPGGSGELSASLRSFMGLTTLQATSAPQYTLIDQAGQPYPLVDKSGKVTVLTFFNGSCNDICPVMAAEIRQADLDLGPASDNVEFVTVNTDPSALAVSGLSAALAQSDLDALPNWHIVTGPLTTMNAVWKSYGIAITVVQHSLVEAHNDAIYFVSPKGVERYRSTPFANESRSGIYSLSSADVTRWGSGIATYARRSATQ
jgi:cytochrome oxidase Cu insertion factor (SCO1/SenC/PrrC family)